MENVCSICYSENDTKDQEYITNCNHFFHKMCIKAWVLSTHSNCEFCPMCRNELNTSEINLFNSNYKTIYEEFIKLDGVVIYGSFILIKMSSPNWKILLKNLLVLMKISFCINNEYTKTMNKSELHIQTDKRNMKFGFILENVKFSVYNIKDLKKIKLNDINETQFNNIVILDKILLEITNNKENVHSIIKSNENFLSRENSKLTCRMSPFARQYIIETKEKCNYVEYIDGKCCVALIPELVEIKKNQYYSLKCIDLAIISGNKNISEKTD